MEDIEIDFDAAAWKAKRAEDERSLLAEIGGHSTDARRATEAAARLLRWYARFGSLEDAGVQRVIEDGTQLVAEKVARAGLGHESRCWIAPLDYFDVSRGSSRARRPPRGTMGNRLRERTAYQDWMTKEELREALSVRAGKTVPLGERPGTVGEVEAWLVDALRAEYKNGVSIEEARSFIRSSMDEIFPRAISWEAPQTRVHLVL